ncbi:WD40 repeat-like protein, partial [Ascodesmis nigricans]
SSAPPPPTPVYILRGHNSQIHSLTFSPRNTHLLSGDSDGYIIIWSLSSRRPTGVWKAHDGGILKVAVWEDPAVKGRGKGFLDGGVRIVTHAREHKLCVWRLPSLAEGETGLDVRMPLEVSGFGGAGGKGTIELRRPWLVACLLVNTLNFCGFGSFSGHDRETKEDSWGPQLLLALPSAADSESIDIMTIPSSRRLYRSIKPPLSSLPPLAASSANPERKTGMAMCLSLHHFRTHSHPAPEHLLLIAGYESGELVVYTTLLSRETLDAGVQLAGDNWTVVYTARPHSQPVLSLASTIENGVLKVYTTSADSLLSRNEIPLSGLAVKQPERLNGKEVVSDTRHLGQQSVMLRSDGKLLTAAGWDGRVRVYAAKGKMRELAVLKWHEKGCYAAAFASVDEAIEDQEGVDMVADAKEMILRGSGVKVESRELARERRETRRHWVAAGDKDGKVSLWEVY